MNSPPPEPMETPARRKLLWAAFWFVFFTTPAALISMPVLFKHFPQLALLNDYGLIECGSALIGGSIMAAFLLARIQSTTTDELATRTLGFSLAFALLFGFLSYGGCMLIK